MTPRSLAVVGVGAIGGAVAADLADLGHEVVLCSRSPFDRLVVTRPGGVTKCETRALTNPTQITSRFDWVLLATKGHQTLQAKPWLDRLCGDGTRLAVLQNGVNHLEPSLARRVSVACYGAGHDFYTDKAVRQQIKRDMMAFIQRTLAGATARTSPE